MSIKNRYSELVKEMFPPTVDRFKQKERELRIEKMKIPQIKMLQKRASST